MHVKHITTNTVALYGGVRRGISNRDAKADIAADIAGLAGCGAIRGGKDAGVSVAAIAADEHTTHTVAKDADMIRADADG